MFKIYLNADFFFCHPKCPVLQFPNVFPNYTPIQILPELKPELMASWRHVKRCEKIIYPQYHCFSLWGIESLRKVQGFHNKLHDFEASFMFGQDELLMQY